MQNNDQYQMDLNLIIQNACMQAYQLGYQQGFQNGLVYGYASAMNKVKPAISDGTRSGSSLCASTLNWYKK